MHKIRGTYTAMITPFTERGELDEEAFVENLCMQVDNEIDGLVILGTTAEAPTLSSNEKACIIRMTINTIQNKIPILIGTGSNSTQQTIEATNQAKDAGADGALIITPYYNKPPQEGLFHHFSAIAEATNFPIMLYNHPGRTGQHLAIETLERLAKIPQIIGLKEAATDLEQLSHLLAFAPHWAVMSGNDSYTLPMMALGAHGVISVASNLIPARMRSITDAMLINDVEAARNTHNELSPLFRALSLDTNPIPIKAAMTLTGLPSGPCRAPLCDLSNEHRQTLKTLGLSQWSPATQT